MSDEHDKRQIDRALDLARAERETLRWVLLTALWHARPYGTTESVILACAQDVGLCATTDFIRRELGWLDSHGLVEIKHGPVWSAKLTALGEDVYDYRAEAPPGLARPPRW